MTTIRLKVTLDHAIWLKNILREVVRDNPLELSSEQLEFAEYFEDRLFGTITFAQAKQYVIDTRKEKENF